MATIRPFRAWRYNDQLIPRLDELTSPLFDVISEKQREALYRNPLNSVHLSVPEGPNPAQHAHDLLMEWKRDGILVQDPMPGIYVYYQYFTLPGEHHEHIRKGFIANLKIHDWDERVLLRHEATIPFSVNDRLEVLHNTQMNIAPTHGLFTDPTHEIEKYLDQAMLSPMYETEDYQGVRDVLAVIHDVKIIQRIMDLLRERQIILADGHHRYESSLLYMKEQMATNPKHTGEEGYNYHLMYFTNTESDDLRILPTHRLVSGIDGFDEVEFLKKLEPWFTIRPIENPGDLPEIILGKPWAFGLLMGDNAYKIRLKEDPAPHIPWDFPELIKRLDLTVMHYFVFEKALGIPGKVQRQAKELSFERNFSECIRKVTRGECQLAVITQDVAIETVKQVCYSGYTLPQKSTYFYPKVICGFLFGSIDPADFHSPFDQAFR
jgi:uncharacterized protein (DUF1015 family)